MRTRVYRNGVLEACDVDPASVSDLLEEPGTVVWMDARPTSEDLAVVAAELDLHPLAQQDAVGRPQRPKLEPYAGHQFLVVYGTAYDESTCEVRLSEVGIFFDSRWLLTVRKDPAFDLDRVVRTWDANATLAKHGVAFLLHGLLDEVVEDHFRVVEQIDDVVEQLDTDLFDPSVTAASVQRRAYELRKALVAVRRVVLPMREVVNSLLTREAVRVDAELRPYYQDVYDHVLRASEWTESLRDLVTSVTETHLTMQGNRLNEIMKKLTSYAAIVAVPTAVAGVYGMNTRLYPAAGSATGWWVAIGLMALISGGLFAYFRNKDWL